MRPLEILKFLSQVPFDEALGNPECDIHFDKSNITIKIESQDPPYPEDNLDFIANLIRIKLEEIIKIQELTFGMTVIGRRIIIEIKGNYDRQGN